MAVNGSECPEIEELAALIDGKLRAEERARIVSHLAGCENCFQVYSETIRFQEEATGLETVPVRPDPRPRKGIAMPGRVRAGAPLVKWIGLSAAAMLAFVVVASLLQKGKESFRREPEVAELNQSARAGLDMISRDLMMAGRKAPPTGAVVPAHGVGATPDEITIVYSDSEVPTSRPLPCDSIAQRAGGSPCGDIDQLPTLRIDPDTFDPSPVDSAKVYSQGTVLFAMESSDCNGDGEQGILQLIVTERPRLSEPGDALTVNVEYIQNDLPKGFNGLVHQDCAIVGRFRVIQYRINPLPPAPNPILERRDMSSEEAWLPVAANIESLQFQYAMGSSNVFLDTPDQVDPNDAATWITRVRVMVGARTESTDLHGGAFSQEDTHLRKTFSTLVNLPHMISAAKEN